MSIWLGHTLEDFGNKYQIKGAIYGDGAYDVYIYLPNEIASGGPIAGITPTFEEWRAFLTQVDNPKLVITDPVSGIVKAIVQKNTRQLQEIFRWGIYRRDKFTCQYCGAQDRPLTIDEYLCQALGGPVNEANCKTACRPCNKAKGHMTPEDWEAFRIKKGLVFNG